MNRVRRMTARDGLLRERHREASRTPVGNAPDRAPPLQLTPFRKNAEGNAFVLQVSTVSRPGVCELVATDQDGRDVVRVVVRDEQSARSLCNEIVALIKRFDPTSLVVIDLDFDAARANLQEAAE
jgi:hypothetical protein